MDDPISGGANAVGTAFGIWDSLSGHSAKQSYKYSRKLQKHQQEWMEQMSNTAHQREVADLEAAGLNPILSAGGQGAVSPSGSTGTIGPGTTGAEAGELMIQSAKAMAELKNLDAQTENINADTANKEQTIKLQPGLIKSMIELNESNSGKARAEKEKYIEEKTKIMTEKKIEDIKKDLIGMDRDKRKQFFQDEVDNYKLQLKRQLIDLGMDSTAIGILLKAIDKTVSAVSPLTNMTSAGGNTYNFTPVNYTN